ncbi:adenylate/guanylate cyclase domain-containing protein [Sorangium sp. So ce131]|uniref:adenylate/guanylate cyclase domain-containing protein n=1 Tax=Sorangium sp. So ce131 TaxID=3133282 RepID=UPI003F615532
MFDHPWTRETRDLGPPIAWRFSFDLQASAEELWPILIDTDRLDRAMRLPLIEYTEQDGVLRGASRLFGYAFRWTERPWAWVAGKQMSTLRVYDNGIATHLVVAFVLEPRSAGGTRLDVHLLWYPRSALSRPLFSVGERHVRAAYRRALERLDQQIAEDRPRHVLLARRPPALGREVQRRLAAIRAELLRDGVKAGVADALVRHVEGADDMDLRRIRVVPLARRWRIDERELVIACLRATRAGLLRLCWELICPHCRGVRQTVRVLGEVPPKASCAPCAAEFSTDAPEAIEVTFQVDPSIRRVDTRVHCLAEAATKQHIHVQQPLDPGERRSLETRLSPGRYRVRIVGEPRHRLLDVLDFLDVLNVNAPRSPVQEVMLREGDKAALRSGPSPVLTLVNEGRERRTFVVEDVRWVDDALRPAALFGLQEFRDLFAFEFLAAKVQIQVGEQTILFSDIVGSTRFYERLGDARAFAAVKRHFHEVYTAVRANRGVVVKTIGDAVMAAFRDPGDALQAAVALQELFHDDRSETGLRLRLTLTMGSCLAVNLNSGIDYFGRTVNLAAKLQGFASAGQIVFPASLRDDPRAQRVLGAQKIPVQELTLDLPFLDEPLDVCRLDLHRSEVAPPVRVRPSRHRRAGMH